MEARNTAKARGTGPASAAGKTCNNCGAIGHIAGNCPEPNQCHCCGSTEHAVRPLCSAHDTPARAADAPLTTPNARARGAAAGRWPSARTARRRATSAERWATSAQSAASRAAAGERASCAAPPCAPPRLQAALAASAPQLFSELPSLDDEGTLRFSVESAERWHLTCITACVGVNISWRDARGRLRATSSFAISIRKDPCGTLSSSRSSFLLDQFDRKAYADALQSLRLRFDGTLTWGLGQTIAFVGGGVRRGRHTEWRRHGDDEHLMHSPSWDAPLPPWGRAKLLQTAASFLPPPNSSKERFVRRELAGQHDFQVAWLAAADSDYVHRPCAHFVAECAALGLPPEADAHEAIERSCRNLTTQSRDRCCRPNTRRPAALAFNAATLQLQAFGRRTHYLDLYGPGGVPPEFLERFGRALEWLVAHHRELNVSVICVGVLTRHAFAEDPFHAEHRIASALARLKRAGLVILTNGGNKVSPPGSLPWPAINSQTIAASHWTASTDRLACTQPSSVIFRGAHYSSAALGFVAAIFTLLVEAARLSSWPWWRQGQTLQDALLRVLHATGVSHSLNTSSGCASPHRWLRGSLAVEEVLDWRGRGFGFGHRSFAFSGPRGCAG